MDRRDFRGMIFYDFMRKPTAKESHNQLKTTFGEKTPSLATVYNWYGEFTHGRKTLSDEVRSGRPADAITPENIQKVKKIIKNERRIVMDEIMLHLDISRGSLHTILHEHLLVRKVAARWIPHKLSEEQKSVRVDWCNFMIKKFNHGRSKQLNTLITGDETWIYQYDPETKQQSSVWIFPDDNTPQKLRRARSGNKQMVASFIFNKGHVATIPLTEQKTVVY